MKKSLPSGATGSGADIDSLPVSEKGAGELLCSFPPVARADATRLILGSMPGCESLAKGEYYAHPRNAFWPIMGILCGFDPAAPFPARCEALREQGIALWDVLAACARRGSLDANIVEASMEPNDIGGFLAAHPGIRLIGFNGGMAERVFRKFVRRRLGETARRMVCVRLPSTSPANAGWSFERKLAAWRGVL